MKPRLFFINAPQIIKKGFKLRAPLLQQQQKKLISLCFIEVFG